MKSGNRFFQKIGFVVLSLLGLALSSARAESFLNYTPPDYWEKSEAPLLAQLIPVNQINLQKGVHMLDAEVLGKSWEGMTNPFDSMGVGSVSTANHESLFRIRYAVALGRYTYIGTTLGVASRWEAELYDESGMVDPEFFVGHHIPWRNGDFRFALTFSPSLGPSSLDRQIEFDQESARGNFYRGGWSVRPEVAMTLRSGKVLFGAEFSYLFFGDRIQEESVSASQEALNSPDTTNGLVQHYLGVDGFTGGASTSQFLQTLGAGESATVQNHIVGGHTWAVKGLIEIPEWQRLGAEFIYGQVSPSIRENDLGKVLDNEGGSFQEIRVYGRYKATDFMSFTPLLSWMPALPSYRGQERMDSTSNVWGAQLTFRSKFQL